MRATYLNQQQYRLLLDWAKNVTTMFHEEIPYHVGSSLERSDWRDVDVRLILDDESFDALGDILDIRRLNFTVSIWGESVAGLPIDFQVQRMTEANREFNGRRHALIEQPRTVV